VTDEAEAALGRYLEAAGPRLRWLRELAARSGGPPAEDLDLSRDSLVPLWAWAMGRLRLRPPGAPLDPARAPLWCAYPVPSTNSSFAARFAASFDDETLELIDGLIYYYAETLIRARPGAHWSVGYLPQPGYVSQGRPVVAGYAAQIDPFTPVSTLIGRVFMDPSSPYYRGPATAEDLRNVFDAVQSAAAEAEGQRGSRA
jgi:hypothetical protein